MDEGIAESVVLARCVGSVMRSLKSSHGELLILLLSISTLFQVFVELNENQYSLCF